MCLCCCDNCHIAVRVVVGIVMAVTVDVYMVVVVMVVDDGGVCDDACDCCCCCK